MNHSILQQRTQLLSTFKQLLDEKGMTQSQLAQRAGMDEGNISRILSAKYPPKLDNFLLLLQCAEITLPELWHAAFAPVPEGTVEQQPNEPGCRQ